MIKFVRGWETMTARDGLLQVLEESFSDCSKCDLHKSRTNLVFGKGNSHSSLVIMGEAPDKTEDEKGEPFVGKAGKLLDNMIASLDLKREAIYILNAIKCRPPNNRPPEDNEIESCKPLWKIQLTIIRPKAILALGNSALFALAGQRGITKKAGKWSQYEEADLKIPVLASFHPAFLLSQPDYKKEAFVHFLDLKDYLNNKKKALQWIS